MNFIELYYILSLLLYMYRYIIIIKLLLLNKTYRALYSQINVLYILLLSLLLSLLLKLYVLVYHKIFMCMNNK